MRAVADEVVQALDISRSDWSNSSRAARKIARNAVAGAAASLHNRATMTTVVAAMDAEFGVPQGAER